MEKQGVFYENGNKRIKVGVEILAQPWVYVSNEELFRVINEDIDFKVFLHHLQHLEPKVLNFLNIKPSTLIKYKEEIIALLKQHDLVVVELSEDYMHDGDLNCLVRLKEVHRFRLCIDDFGKNSSNIDRVVALLPEFLKLDISMFPSEKGLKALIETINQISPTTRIIAEKVETMNDLKFVKSLGIKLWQGELEKDLPQIKPA